MGTLDATREGMLRIERVKCSDRGKELTLASLCSIGTGLGLDAAFRSRFCCSGDLERNLVFPMKALHSGWICRMPLDLMIWGRVASRYIWLLLELASLCLLTTIRRIVCHCCIQLQKIVLCESSGICDIGLNDCAWYILSICSGWILGQIVVLKFEFL